MPQQTLLWGLPVHPAHTSNTPHAANELATLTVPQSPVLTVLCAALSQLAEGHPPRDIVGMAYKTLQIMSLRDIIHQNNLEGLHRFQGPRCSAGIMTG